MPLVYPPNNKTRGFRTTPPLQAFGTAERPAKLGIRTRQPSRRLRRKTRGSRTTRLPVELDGGTAVWVYADATTRTESSTGSSRQGVKQLPQLPASGSAFYHPRSKGLGRQNWGFSDDETAIQACAASNLNRKQHGSSLQACEPPTSVWSSGRLNARGRPLRITTRSTLSGSPSAAQDFTAADRTSPWMSSVPGVSDDKTGFPLAHLRESWSRPEPNN